MKPRRPRLVVDNTDRKGPFTRAAPPPRTPPQAPPQTPRWTKAETEEIVHRALYLLRNIRAPAHEKERRVRELLARDEL